MVHLNNYRGSVEKDLMLGRTEGTIGEWEDSACDGCRKLQGITVTST